MAAGEAGARGARVAPRAASASGVGTARVTALGQARTGITVLVTVLTRIYAWNISVCNNVYLC